MFYYDNTHEVSKPRERQRKVVTQIRKVTYINHHPDPKVEEPLVTEGWEIVKEMVWHPDYEAPLPKVVGPTKTIDHREQVRMFKNNLRDLIKENKNDRQES